MQTEPRACYRLRRQDSVRRPAGLHWQGWLYRCRAAEGRQVIVMLCSVVIDRGELSVDDDPATWQVCTVDVQGPHRQAAISAPDFRRNTDEHPVARRLGDSNGAGELMVTDAARVLALVK